MVSKCPVRDCVHWQGMDPLEVLECLALIVFCQHQLMSMKLQQHQVMEQQSHEVMKASTKSGGDDAHPIKDTIKILTLAKQSSNALLDNQFVGR